MFSDLHHRYVSTCDRTGVTDDRKGVTCVTCVHLWHGSPNMWRFYTVIYWRGYFTVDKCIQWTISIISKYQYQWYQVRVVFLQWLPWILRMGRPGEKITRFSKIPNTSPKYTIPNTKYMTQIHLPKYQIHRPNTLSKIQNTSPKYTVQKTKYTVQKTKFVTQIPNTKSQRPNTSSCWNGNYDWIQMLMMFRKSIMMQNKMKELEEKEKSSKTCLANILDLGESGRPSSRYSV